MMTLFIYKMKIIKEKKRKGYKKWEKERKKCMSM